MHLEKLIFAFVVAGSFALPASAIETSFESDPIPDFIEPVGNLTWFVGTSKARTGSRSLHSVAVTNLATSEFDLRIPSDQSYSVSFWARVISPTTDAIRVQYPDRNVTIGTNNAWELVELGTFAPDETIRFVFQSSAVFPGTGGRGFIDDLVLTPMASGSLLPVEWKSFIPRRFRAPLNSFLIPGPTGHDALDIFIGGFDLFYRHQRWSDGAYQLLSSGKFSNHKHATVSQSLTEPGSFYAATFSFQDESYLDLGVSSVRTYPSEYSSLFFGDLDGDGDDEKIAFKTVSDTLNMMLLDVGSEESLWSIPLELSSSYELELVTGEFFPSRSGLEIAFFDISNLKVVSSVDGAELAQYPVDYPLGLARVPGTGADNLLFGYGTLTELNPRSGDTVGVYVAPFSCGNFKIFGRTAYCIEIHEDKVYRLPMDGSEPEEVPLGITVFRLLDAGDFDPAPGNELLLDTLTGQRAMYNEFSGIPVWEKPVDEWIDRYFVVGDFDGEDGMSVLTAPDTHPAGSATLGEYDLDGLVFTRTLELSVSDTASSDTIGLHFGQANSDIGDELVLLRRQNGSGTSTIAHFIDPLSGNEDRLVEISLLLEAPTLIEPGQLFAVQEDAPENFVQVDLQDGSVSWTGPAQGAAIVELLAGQLDSDSSRELVVLDADGAVRVYDVEAQTLQWDLETTGVHSVVSIDGDDLYLGFDDRIEKYADGKFQTVRVMPGPSERLWHGTQQSGTYLFSLLRLGEDERVLVIDSSDLSLVGVSPKTGPGFGESSRPQVIDAYTGMVLVGATSVSLVTGTIARPDFPAPGTIFRAGFE